MRRSLALIAIGVALATGAAVVIGGMSSGGGEAAGASTDQSAGSLPAGHPSIAAGQSQNEQTAADTIAWLEKRRKKNPDDVGVLLALGDAYFASERLSQAAEAYTGALTRQPGNAAAQVGLAMVWHAQGDSKRAETALQAVLDAHPDDQDAHYSLAIVYFSTGRVGEAKTEWQTAARIDPTSATGRRSRSFVDLLENQQSSSPAAGK